MHKMGDKSTYLIIAKDGVIERRAPDNKGGGNILEDFYNHLVNSGETPWKNSKQSEKELRSQAINKLKTIQSFDKLNPEEQEQEIKNRVGLLDYISYQDYFIKQGGQTWEPYMKRFLDDQNPPWVRHFTWGQTKEVESLLKGNGTLAIQSESK